MWDLLHKVVMAQVFEISQDISLFFLKWQEERGWQQRHLRQYINSFLLFWHWAKKTSWGLGIEASTCNAVQKVDAPSCAVRPRRVVRRDRSRLSAVQFVFGFSLNFIGCMLYSWECGQEVQKISERQEDGEWMPCLDWAIYFPGFSVVGVIIRSE